MKEIRYEPLASENGLSEDVATRNGESRQPAQNGLLRKRQFPNELAVHNAPANGLSKICRNPNADSRCPLENGVTISDATHDDNMNAREPLTPANGLSPKDIMKCKRSIVDRRHPATNGLAIIDEGTQVEDTNTREPLTNGRLANGLRHHKETSITTCKPVTDDNQVPPAGGTVAIPTTTTRSRVVRNLLLLGLASFLQYSGFWSLSNLESTMNAQDSIGPDSQAIIYLCSMASCFVPELLIGRLGCKATVVLSLLMGTPLFAANFRLRWDAAVITSVLYGFASGPLNTAIATYMDEMAVRYRSESAAAADEEGVKACFFGFYMVFQEATQIFGNGVSYYVLDLAANDSTTVHPTGHCGIGFRPGSDLNNTNLDPPSEQERFVLTGAYLSMSVLAVLVALFLDPLGNDLRPAGGCGAVWERVVSAAKHLQNPHQLLLLPINVYCGLQGAFFTCVLTQAFIACSWGVHHVGFVTICFGVCGVLMSSLVGTLVKCTSQMTVILLAALVNVITYSLLFVWSPSPENPALYFVFSGVFGLTDAIWWSQIPALYGKMFSSNREAAFSNFYLWGFFGFFISFMFDNELTVATKITIILTFLVVGIVLYVAGQIQIMRAARADSVAEVDGRQTSGYAVLVDED